MKSINKIEIYNAVDAFGRCQAVLKVWLRKVYNESLGRQETVRSIVSVQGVADLGNAKVWTRGKAIPAFAKTQGLPSGLQWKKV